MKLKPLKTAIKVWCKDENVTVCKRIKVATQLQDISNKLLLSPLSENLHEEHKFKSELNKWLAHDEEEPHKSREVRLHWVTETPNIFMHPSRTGKLETASIIYMITAVYRFQIWMVLEAWLLHSTPICSTNLTTGLPSLTW